MEIHTPESPIQSVKQFLIHMAMVTLGILIALGLEGVNQHFHHEALAHQAHANFENEITQNHKQVEEVLANNRKLRDAISAMIEKEPAWRQGKLKKVPTLNVSAEFTSLRTTSWDTAEATQALAYMDFQQVEHYARVYHMQRQFNDLESRAEQLWFDITGFRGDPNQLTPDEVRTGAHDLNIAFSYANTIDDLGQRLLKEYEKKQ